MVANEIIGLNMIKSFILGIALYLIVIFSAIAKDKTPNEAAVELNNNLLIIDVRSKSEWKETGVIANA